MYRTLLSVALFFTFALNTVFAEFAVSTPEITTCKDQETKVSWEPTNSPSYSLLVVSANDPCGDPLFDAGDYKQTFASFKAEGLQVGQKVQVSLEDANGDEGWSDIVTVAECPASSSSASASVSASDLSSVDPALVKTTLVVTPTYTANVGSSSSSQSVDPVGAANAENPFNPNSSTGAAAVPRRLSIPALALSAFGGVIALLV